MKTGAIILGFISAIFGVDAILATGSHATISEFTYNFLHHDPLIGFTVLVGSFGVLIAHFWYFRPLK
jgi:hypothetical protein